METESSFSDKYSQKVLDPTDKKILDEALRCADNECYRASYIMIWISIVESLKRKINILNAIGSTHAKTAVKKINEAEKDKRSIDKDLISYAFDCGLIGVDQRVTMDYLWARRSLFAHPYEKHPLESDLVEAVNHALDISLGREIHYSRQAIDEKIEVLSSQPHIVGTKTSEIVIYVNDFIELIKEADYKYAHDKAQLTINNWFKEKPSAGNMYVYRRLGIFIKKILCKESIDFSDPKWKIDHAVEHHCFETWATMVSANTWNKFSDRNRSQLIRFITPSTIFKYKVSIALAVKGFITF